MLTIDESMNFCFTFAEYGNDCLQVLHLLANKELHTPWRVYKKPLYYWPNKLYKCFAFHIEFALTLNGRRNYEFLLMRIRLKLINIKPDHTRTKPLNK